MPPARSSQPSLDLKSLSALWAKGTFHPVYLFAGPDALQKEEAVRLLQTRLLPGDDSGLNVDKFDGETAKAGEVINAVQTLPFLGGRRLVVVRRAHGMAASDTGRLADALASLPAGNCLALLWDEKLDARSVLVQAVKSAGVATTFWTPFEDQLPRWIMERAEAAGKTMGPPAARALLESVGPSLPDLAQEVEKLALYVKDRKSIEPADVQSLGGGNRTLQFLEWDRALWRRDRAKALGLLEVLRSQGQPPEALLAQLSRVYQKLLLGKALLSDRQVSRQDMWDRLWIRTRQPQEEFLEALSSFSWEDLLGALKRMLGAERDLKTGRLDGETGLSLLVYRLTEK